MQVSEGKNRGHNFFSEENETFFGIITSKWWHYKMARTKKQRYRTKNRNVMVMMPMIKKKMRKSLLHLWMKNNNTCQKKKTMLLINISVSLSCRWSLSPTCEFQMNVLWRGLRNWITGIQPSDLSTRAPCFGSSKNRLHARPQVAGQTLKHQVLSTVDETFSYITLVIPLQPQELPPPPRARTGHSNNMKLITQLSFKTRPPPCHLAHTPE